MPIQLRDRTRPSLYNQLAENESHVKDLKIVCDDGVVESYQAVFAWASSLLRRQFVGKFVMEDSGKRKDDVTVYLPEVAVEVVNTLTSVLVRGEVTSISSCVKKDLEILWKSLAIDRVEFDKLDISEITKVNKKPKNVQNIKTGPKPTKSKLVHTIPDDTPKKLVNVKKARQKTSLSKIIVDIPQKALGSEEVPTKDTANENNHVLTLDNYEDVSIIVPGYENVEIDEKSLICNLEDVPVVLDNSRTSFEISRDIPPVFPTVDDTLESQTINVLKRKQNEVDNYIEQRLKASKLEKQNKAPKVTPKLFATKQQQVVIKSTMKEISLKPTKIVDPEVEPLACYVCNSVKDKEKRALNLKNVFYLKNHISKCLYMSGRLFAAIDPGDENRDADGRPVDEFGLKNSFWYRCEIEGCWLQQKKGVHGQVCYKVFAIHMASQHGVVEAVMVEDGNEAALELVQKIRDHEERRNGAKINPKFVKEVNTNEKASSPVIKKKEIVNSFELEETVDNPASVNPFTMTSSAKKKPVNRNEESSQEEYEKSPEFKILGINGYHNCFICNGVGKNNKDGIGISFKDIPTLKEHYARCIYNESKYFHFVSPGEGNTAVDGSAVDEFGQINGVMYKCPVKGCWLQKKTGERGKVCYKVYAIHMASQHGIIEQILEADSRPVMQEILMGLKLLDQVKNGIARCKFDSCATMQFKADSKRELKLHYASMHFRNYFKTNPETGIPPGFTKSGTRAICENCSEKAGKPVYIQGDREAVVGHLVVKHDVLADILKEAGETVKEAREVISDIYPDQLTEVYMDTLEKETIPFNEDFMKMIAF
eukprot:GFUD01020998.1.p1 GENE.GFUD01020998.1~~GFUD01020998.1.p1  ORF type:complete len:822 (+),score=261.57 GFUD01020998.1:62-2527(+)